MLHHALHTIPIPGTTSVAHVREDLEAVDLLLSAEVMVRLEATVNGHTIVVRRYNAQASGEVDTEAV